MAAETRLHIFTHIRCNNNCIFCLDHFRTDDMFIYEPGKKEISAEDLHAILDRYSPETGKMLFTTGEPTLHSGLPEFIRICKDRGFSEIGVISNGRMFAYREFCEELLEAGLNRISVSIHGQNRRIQQSHTRARGSFEQTVLGLHNLHTLSEQFSFILSTSTTVTKINLPHLHEMIPFFGRFIVDGQIILNPVIPIGAALKFRDNVLVGMSEIAGRIAAVKRNLEGDGNLLSENISVMDIPQCVMAAAKNRPTPGSNRERVIGGLKSAEINDAEIEVQPKLKRDECSTCAFASSCDGVFTGYIRFFGWDEFVPVTNI